MKKITSLLLFVMLGPLALLRAHLLPPNEQGVSMSAWYTVAKNVAEAKKFWMLLGGTPGKIDGGEVIKFPGLIVFVAAGDPSGGTVGSSINHVGFHVPNGVELVTKLKAAGVKMDPNAGTRLPNPQGSSWGNIYSPDDLKVELLDSARSTAAIGTSSVPAPSPLKGSIATDHIHFSVPEPSIAEAQDWYAKHFGAVTFDDLVPRPNQPVASGNIPGVELKFSKPAGGTSPTKGRALEAIGFEVKNLSTFCKNLEASGVKLDQPYSKTRHKSYASAQFTDPWGTTVELTEGLNKF